MFEKLWELLQAAFEALVPFVVLYPFERGVLVRLGKFVRELDAGFHWCYPLHIDQVFHENVVPRTEHLPGLSTTTADGVCVGFDAVVTYRVNDIRKALLEVNDLKDAVADTCAGQIGTTLSESKWESIWHGDAVENLTAVCRKRGWKWGIEIIQVQLAGVVRTRNLRISTGSSVHSQQLHITP